MELLSYIYHGANTGTLDSGRLPWVVDTFDLHGVETLLFQDVPVALAPLIRGIHMPYRPVWLPFWFEDFVYLRDIFPGLHNLELVFGGTRPQALVVQMRQWIQHAMSFMPEYMVFHVANCGLEEVYSLRFSYGKKVVLEGFATWISTGPFLPLKPGDSWTRSVRNFWYMRCVIQALNS